jgi:hypothetical protein
MYFRRVNYVRLRLWPMQISTNSGVKSVLDGVITASREQFGNIRPVIAQAFVCRKENLLFLREPGVLYDQRVEVVMPALPALLP